MRKVLREDRKWTTSPEQSRGAGLGMGLVTSGETLGKDFSETGNKFQEAQG